MTIGLRTFFEKRADPKRGARQTYAVPSYFLREVFRREESGLYTQANDFEPAYRRFSGSKFMPSTTARNRESYYHLADPQAENDQSGSSAYIAFTDFSEGLTDMDRRYGTSLIINGTAHYRSQLEHDRTFFAMKGYFSEDGQTFHLHNLHAPHFENSHHNGAQEMYVFRDHDIMTAFAFARAITNQIFNDGRTSNTPYVAWQEQTERYYHGRNPVWQTRLTDGPSSELKPRRR